MKLSGFDNLEPLQWVVCTFKVGFCAANIHKEEGFFFFYSYRGIQHIKNKCSTGLLEQRNAGIIGIGWKKKIHIVHPKKVQASVKLSCLKDAARFSIQ